MRPDSRRLLRALAFANTGALALSTATFILAGIVEALFLFPIFLLAFSLLARRSHSNPGS